MNFSNDTNFSGNHGSSSPLIEGEDVIIRASADHGHSVQGSTSGGWKAAYFVIAVGVAERFAYYGVHANLITYLTGPIGQSVATAAENANTWSGTALLLPVLGAFVADCFLGIYHTIVAAFVIYILGLGMLTVSVMLTTLDISDSQASKTVNGSSPWFKDFLFFISLYVVAIGQGGFRPCIQAFGADQFVGQDPMVTKEKSSFFNWWNFSISISILSAVLILVYIQDDINWSLGYGIPFLSLLSALLVFLLGTRTYRYSVGRNNDHNPFLSTARMVAGATKTWLIRTGVRKEGGGNPSFGCCEQSKSLNQVLIASEDGFSEDPSAGRVGDAEETRALLRLILLWITNLGFALVYAQRSTFFTKQGATMNSTVFSGFQIPAASLQCFIYIALIIFLPIYDRIFVPLARALTRKPSGITMLQRIGTGLVFSFLSMVSAALVEMKRLEIAKQYGLVDLPNITLPMGIWWLAPQYALSGLGDVFGLVGIQEFFYDQVPKEFSSVGLSLYFCLLGVGNFLSSFIVSIIDKYTGGDGGESWLTNNLNQGHLDYFYWLLAAVSAIGFISFLFFSRSYIYSREITC